MRTGALADDDVDGATEQGWQTTAGHPQPKSVIKSVKYSHRPFDFAVGEGRRSDGQRVDFSVFLHRVLLIISHRWVARAWFVNADADWLQR